MTTPIDFGNCSQAVPHERRFNPRAKPKRSPGPGSYDIINTPTDVTTKYKTTPTYKMGSSTAPRFNKKAHDTISPGPGIYQLNPSVGDQTLSTKRSAGRVTFNMGKRGEKKRYQGSLVHAYIDPHSRLDTRSASAFGASTADRFAQSKRDILNSCSPGPGSAWKHGIYSGLSKRGGATLGTARRFMNDKTLSTDASLNQSIVESVTDKKSFYEEDHARPGPGQYEIPTTMGPYPDSKMRSVVVPVFTEGTRETKPPKQTPGPSDYDGRSTMGRQPISTKRSEPGFRFGAAERPIGKSI